MTMEDMGDERNEILEDFFTEADENLDTLEQDVIKLEALADDGDVAASQDTLDRIHTMLSTLKAGAGFLGLEKMAQLAQAGENLVDEVRQGRVVVSKPVIDALLQGTDMLKQLIIIRQRREEDADFESGELVEILDALADGQEVEFVAASEPVAEVVQTKPEPVKAKGTAVNGVLLGAAPEEAEMVIAAPVEVPVEKVETQAPARAKSESKATRGPKAPVVKTTQVGPAVAKSGAPAGQPKDAGNGSETTRVETAQLDKVMGLVGELVLVQKTMLRQLESAPTRKAIGVLDNAAALFATMEQLSRVTQELQMGVIAARMPLTQVVVDALIVGASDEGFVIPIGDIAEVVKLKAEGVQQVNEQDVMEVRGEAIPLYYLDSLTRGLLVPTADNAAVQATTGHAPKTPSGFVVVVREGTMSMGLVVDSLLGQEQVIVKPVNGMFEHNKAVAGATITGEGKVHMILDVTYLMKGMAGFKTAC